MDLIFVLLGGAILGSLAAHVVAMAIIDRRWKRWQREDMEAKAAGEEDE